MKNIITIDLNLILFLMTKLLLRLILSCFGYFSLLMSSSYTPFVYLCHFCHPCIWTVAICPQQISCNYFSMKFLLKQPVGNMRYINLSWSCTSWLYTGNALWTEFVCKKCTTRKTFAKRLMVIQRFFGESSKENFNLDLWCVRNAYQYAASVFCSSIL